MSDAVKARRAYRSARRAEAAAGTRRTIVEAAGRLFREHGYAVQMPAIAAEAGVAVETIYRTFGTKAALFRAVVDALLAGGTARAEVPVEDRPAIRAIRAESDPTRQVARYAATQPSIHRRAGPLLRALRDVKATDPDLARLWSALESARLEGQARFIAFLADTGGLRRDRSIDVATDILWTLSSLAVYDAYVTDRGWTDADYQAWLTGALVADLVAIREPGQPAAAPA